MMCGLIFLLSAVFAVVRCGLVPHSLFEGKHAAENLAMLGALENLPLGQNIGCIIMPLVVAVLYIKIRKKAKIAYAGAALTIALFFALDGVYQPVVLNVKSNKPVVEKILEVVPEGTMYSYITNTDIGNRLHHFTINFYMGNRVVPFVDFAPEEGYVLVGKKEYDSFMQNYGGSYCIEKVEEIGEFKSNDTRDITSLYRFSKKQ